MASVILTAAGAAIGSSYAGIFGRVALGMTGTYLGGMIDNLIFGSTTKTKASRLDSLKVDDASYGAGIAKMYGKVRVAGNLIWSSDLIETVTTSTSSTGGKGGGSKTVTETVTYKVNLAIALGESLIGGISRIWADGDLIYNYGWEDELLTGDFNVYLGTTNQLADPVMIAALGTANVPAYRGIAYVVLEGLQLEDFGNRIPNLEFELIPADLSSLDPIIYPPPTPEVGEIVTTVEDLGQSTYVESMSPIIIGQNLSSNRIVFNGGFDRVDGTHATVSISAYTVKGEIPVLQGNYYSDEFEIAQPLGYSTWSILQLGSRAWSKSPDERYIAIIISNPYNLGTNTGTQTNLILFDTVSKQFGTLFTFAPTYKTSGNINWLDAQHFAVSGYATTSGTRPGIYIFAREGLNIISKGFFNVFSTSRYFFYIGGANNTLTYYNGGLLYVVKNTSSGSSNYVYLRYIYWKDNTLTVSSEVELPNQSWTSSGGNGLTLINYSGNEFIAMLDDLVTTLYLMSFSFSFNYTSNTPTITTTRAWQALTFTFGNVDHRKTRLLNDQLLSIATPTAYAYPYLATIDILTSSFSTLKEQSLVSIGSTYTYFSMLPINGNKVLYQGLIRHTSASYYSWIADLCVITLNAGYAVQDLSYIVSNILQSAGFTSTDYNVDNLVGTEVIGFIISEPTTAREMISLLRQFALFDLIEEDGQLRAFTYSDTATDTVTITEMQASLEGEEPTDLINFTRTQEHDLPLAIVLDYNDSENDFEVGTQQAKRIVTNALNTTKIQLPITMDSSVAKQLAERLLYSAWAERISGTVNVSAKHLDITPGDVIDFNGTILRIVSVTNKGYLLEIKGTAVVGSAYISNASGVSGNTVTSVTAIPYITLHIFNLPAMLTSHDTSGIFLAASYTTDWQTCSAYRSLDNVDYSYYSAVNTPAVVGYTTTTLSDGSTDFIDRNGSVTVTLDSGELESVELLSLLNGINIALIGEEIIQFATATLISTNTYTLTGLLRGRFGTEFAASTHTTGEKFLLITNSTINFISTPLTELNRSYYFKIATTGQNLDTAIPTSGTYLFNNLKPLSPTHIKGSRASGAGSDLTITWVRRARINADWVDNIDVPLDETSEQYEIDIMDGTTILRTISTTSTSSVYTAAQQTSDWGTVPSTITVNIYQLSARVGRGRVGIATI